MLCTVQPGPGAAVRWRTAEETARQVPEAKMSLVIDSHLTKCNALMAPLMVLDYGDWLHLQGHALCCSMVPEHNRLDNRSHVAKSATEMTRKHSMAVAMTSPLLVQQ
jgi:hypothetical protein